MQLINECIVYIKILQKWTLWEKSDIIGEVGVEQKKGVVSVVDILSTAEDKRVD
jgi:hypothetical protein